ncbi:MAG: hypothetical protein QMD14_05915 [Candidatus Aenigmarchaeota archaeon]|nr:hypothetical protein [Candidatus Aenigmarchaeota archaeon]
MSKKAKGYIKNLELLLDSLEDIKSVFEGKMTAQSLRVLKEITEKAIGNIFYAFGYVNSLEKILYGRDWISGKLETYGTREELKIKINDPDFAKDIYLLTSPIAHTYRYLDELSKDCEYYRRRMIRFKELKQDRTSFEIEIEEFQEVNKLRLEYRIKDLKHLIESLKK